MAAASATSAVAAAAEAAPPRFTAGAGELVGVSIGQTPTSPPSGRTKPLFQHGSVLPRAPLATLGQRRRHRCHRRRRCDWNQNVNGCGIKDTQNINGCDIHGCLQNTKGTSKHKRAATCMVGKLGKRRIHYVSAGNCVENQASKYFNFHFGIRKSTIQKIFIFRFQDLRSEIRLPFQ